MQQFGQRKENRKTGTDLNKQMYSSFSREKKIECRSFGKEKTKECRSFSGENNTQRIRQRTCREKKSACKRFGIGNKIQNVAVLVEKRKQKFWQRKQNIETSVEGRKENVEVSVAKKIIMQQF